MRTVEELLAPRYKVIADWPGVAGKVRAGDILHMDEFTEGLYWVGGEQFMDDKLKDYPHLFKKLEWWEEREPEDMPNYVKAIMGKNKGSYYKVADKSQNFRMWHVDGEIEFIHLQRFAHFFIPVTKEKYLNQQSDADQS